jgi:hypothetical protein
MASNAGPLLKLPLTYLLGLGSLLTLLVLSNGPAFAEWMEVAATDNVTSYMDPERVLARGLAIFLCRGGCRGTGIVEKE